MKTTAPKWLRLAGPISTAATLIGLVGAIAGSAVFGMLFALGLFAFIAARIARSFYD
jgi:hypothetical protein